MSETSWGDVAGVGERSYRGGERVGADQLGEGEPDAGDPDGGHRGPGDEREDPDPTPDLGVFLAADRHEALYGLLFGGFVLLAVHHARPEILAVAALSLVMVGLPVLLDRPALPDPVDALRVERTLEVRPPDDGAGEGSQNAAGDAAADATDGADDEWVPIAELAPAAGLADVVEPGDEVRVRVAVQHGGDGWLPWVRLRDRPPADVTLAEDDSPAAVTALRAGDVDSFEYTVTVPRGRLEWGAPEITVGTLSGRTSRSATLTAAGDGELRTARDDPAAALPVRTVTSLFAGRLPSSQPGDGLEFHATREYRSGDPLSRVDWHRLARTGELGTVQFRTEHLASVVLLVDARRAAYLAADAGTDAEHAVDRSVRVARRAFEGLLDEGNRVGIAALSEREVWLPPRVGYDHRAQGAELLLTDEAFSSTPPAAALYEEYEASRRTEQKDELIERIDARFAGRGEVVLLSPCCDAYPGQVARRLAALGHHVTVVSPDPTAERELGHRLRRLQRAYELRQLRRDGVRVIDWGDERFDVALERADRRWSR